MVNGFDQKKTRALFDTVVLETGYLPARGIVYSLLFHALTFSLVLFVSVSGVLAPPRSGLERRPEGERLNLTEVVYLPVLDSGAADPSPGERAGGPDRVAVAPPEGLSYPGPQEILSEVPDATNSFQTVLRPALENPETLELSLALPNLIQLEDRALVQAEAPSREVLVAPVPETATPTEERPAELARIDLDVQARADLSALAAELDRARALPVSEVPLGLPERSLESVEAADLGVLARDNNPLQALPARQVDLALPTRTLVPVEPTSLSALAIERSRVEPLPVREAEVVLPTRTLEAGPTSETLDGLTSGRRAFQPLEVSPVELGLPSRELAAVDPVDLADLSATGRMGRRSNEGLPVAPPPSARPQSGFDLPQLDATDGGGGDLEDILALSPMPASDPDPLPRGEARGVFAISATPNLDTSETRPGVSAEAAAVAEGETGTFAEYLGARGAGPRDATAESEVPETPGGAGESGTEGRGVRVVGGSGTGTSSGNPFPGITILAGGSTPPASPAQNGLSIVGGSTPGTESSPTGAAGPPGPPEPRGAPGFLQRSYGVSVVTTESSGGGLPEFGVFSDEQVHTVFLDMREHASDPTPAWTVEYGVPRGTRVETSLGDDDDAVIQGFVLPFPIDRVQPTFPAQIAERFPDQMVIAYAVIGADGLLGEISVKRSPDPRLVQPVHDALARWKFRAARLEGVIVPVKMLLGIPLTR